MTQIHSCVFKLVSLVILCATAHLVTPELWSNTQPFSKHFTTDKAAMTTSESTGCTAAVTIKIPPFWPADPNAWFLHLEAQFRCRGIKDSTTKFYHIVSGLQPEAISLLYDVIQSPSAATAYEDLKRVMTQRLGDPTLNDFQRLLQPADDSAPRRPTCILMETRRILGPDGELLRRLFLRRLPARIRDVVAASDSSDVNALAAMADKIFDASPPTLQCSAVSRECEELRERVSALTKQLKRLQSKSPSPRRNTQRSQPSAQGNSSGSSKCWYHRRFGGAARKCEKPCSEKRKDGALVASSAPSLSTGRLLKITDLDARLTFLIDTGASISLVPPTQQEKRSAPSYNLQAANGSPIASYGHRSISINLGLSRTFRWIFTVANVTQPILGADFLHHFSLSVDLRRNRLLDSKTQTHTQQLASAPKTSVSGISLKSALLTGLLGEFPELTQTPQYTTKPLHNVTHHIPTTGPPVATRARRLCPEKLRIAKNEFQHLLDLKMIRPSKSSWSSALHMVAKKSGDWRPCGDFRRLNDASLPDRYMVPHLHDFSSNLHGCSIFCKIDLVNLNRPPETSLLRSGH